MDITKKFENRQVIEGLTLGGLHNEARWCAWQTELRERGPKVVPAKLGYGIDNRWARSNKPDRWMTWTQAMNLLAKGLNPDLRVGPCGVGILLGDLGPRYDGLVLIGADLDSCLGSDGVLEEWAAEALAALGPVYAEVSPSGTGVKAFMLAQSGDVAAIREELGMCWSRVWKREGGVGEHKAGLELHTGHRWFTVTGDMTGPLTPLGVAGLDALKAYAAVGSKWFPDSGRGRRGGSGSAWGGDAEVTDAMIKSVVVPEGGCDESEDLTAEESGLIERLPGVAALWNRTAVLGSDKTGSAELYRLGGALRRAMVGQEAGIRLMFKCPWAFAYYQSKGEWEGRRQFARAWFRHDVGVAESVLGKVDADVRAAGKAAVEETFFPKEKGKVTGDVPNDKLFPFSQEVLACTMVDDYGYDLRWVDKWGKWMLYNGWKWEEDDKRKAKLIARKVCRLAAAESSPAMQPKLLEAKTSAAVETLAKSDARVAMSVSVWDADPWLLNTPTGVVDLRTGDRREGRRDAYMTMSTSVGPEGLVDSPLWSAFLAQVTNKNKELENYLRRVAGYLLTGSTREHKLFFLYGTGGNGKSTFMNVLSSIMGLEGYAQTADMDMFVVERSARHKTELARLRGARLVTVAETAKGKTLDEQRINKLTGGDPIEANFMRQDMFTFYPEFKLAVCGNHKPVLDGVNEAIARRLDMIPFLVKILQKDENLAEKLREEHSQILAWAIRGCLEWQRVGLCPPACVVNETALYLAEADSRGRWFAESYDMRQDFTAGDVELFNSWIAWSSRNGEKPGSKKDLGEWLKGKGFEWSRLESGIVVWKKVKAGSQVPDNVVKFPKNDT